MTIIVIGIYENLLSTPKLPEELNFDVFIYHVTSHNVTSAGVRPPELGWLVLVLYIYVYNQTPFVSMPCDYNRTLFVSMLYLYVYK